MNGINYHRKENQLFRQVEDVNTAVADLRICLKLALHDKEQFIKEYGSNLYGLLVGLNADINKASEKMIEIMY